MHKMILTLIALSFGLSGCTEKSAEPNKAIDSNIAPTTQPSVDVAPAAQTTTFDPVDFTASLRQIHYALPVTKSDIMDEASILIEGALTEPPDMVVIDKCLVSFQEGGSNDIPILSSIQKASDEYWPDYLKNDTEYGAATQAANMVFTACAAAEISACYASCETYGAIAAVLAGPKGLKHVTE